MVLLNLLNVLFIQMIIDGFEACYHFTISHETLKLGFVVPGYLHWAKVKLVDIVFWSYSLSDLNILTHVTYHLYFYSMIWNALYRRGWGLPLAPGIVHPQTIVNIGESRFPMLFTLIRDHIILGILVKFVSSVSSGTCSSSEAATPGWSVFGRTSLSWLWRLLEWEPLTHRWLN